MNIDRIKKAFPEVTVKQVGRATRIDVGDFGVDFTTRDLSESDQDHIISLFMQNQKENYG